MIAPAPFDWIPTAVAVGTLGLGSILTMVAQGFTDRRARKRETIARLDNLRVELYKDDRAILHALQDSTLDMARFLANISDFYADEHEDPDGIIGQLMTREQRNHFNDLLRTNLTLYYRCRFDEVSVAVQAYMDSCNKIYDVVTYGELAEEWDKGGESFSKVQQEIGRELRRDPLGDLGRPPRRFPALRRQKPQR